ncbi:hypothetical protein RND71_019133 [Anisodus tanguticus]|uniref:Uncharacterized protein n=1 Tax=Anisodus tanguticus TaxID=243964 RepID=A0AAE1RYJ0_9SOLA|nr:hypothetical protein RND71_019133 [Anisodus tanguticus]
MKKVTFIEGIPYVKWMSMEVSRMEEETKKEQAQKYERQGTYRGRTIQKYVPKVLSSGKVVTYPVTNVNKEGQHHNKARSKEVMKVINYKFDRLSSINEEEGICSETNKLVEDKINEDDRIENIVDTVEDGFMEVEIASEISQKLLLKKRDKVAVLLSVEVNMQSSIRTNNIPTSPEGSKHVMSKNEWVMSEDLQSDGSSSLYNSNIEEGQVKEDDAESL